LTFEEKKEEKKNAFPAAPNPSYKVNKICSSDLQEMMTSNTSGVISWNNVTPSLVTVKLTSQREGHD